MLESTNEPMRLTRAEAGALIAAGELHADLSELLDAGLTVVDGGVFFTRAFRANGNLRASYTDLTGQEAFINKLHLDDLVDVDSAGWATICVAQGVLLAGRVLETAAAMTPISIDIVVTVDLGGLRQVGDEVIESFPSSTFRFFVRRVSQPWMSNDLDGFTEAVALLQRG